MMTVATLTRNVRLSKETIRRCRNIIENSDPNPHDKNRSTDTLAEIFYRNGGFDEKINKRFSESAIKKILKGRLVDDLTVREFLFFLKLIPQTDPKGDIDAFLDKPSPKTSSIISPYPLSREELNFDGLKISLSSEASEGIKQCITCCNELSYQIIATQCGLSKGSIHNTLTPKPLKQPKSWPKATFERILTAFLDNGVITLPEGQTPETLLTVIIEPYPLSENGIILCGGNTASFSEDAAARIVDKLEEMGVTQTQIERDAELISGSAWLILKKKPLKSILKERFNRFLNALIANGVIKLPESQTLEQLLYPEAESSYTPTPETLNTAQNCAAVGGEREREKFKHSQPSYNPPPSNDKPRRRPIRTPRAKGFMAAGSCP